MQDKKKLIVLGALVVVVLGVGAFSFMGGGSTPPPVAEDATAKKAEPKDEGTGEKTVKVDEQGNPIPTEGDEPEVANPLYATNLPQRDPFASRNMPGEQNPQATVPQTPQLPNPAHSGAKKPVRRQIQGRAGYEPYRPPAMSGDLQLPSAGGGSVTISQTGPDPSQFGYTVSGVITGGNKPAAVFTDSTGNQRLVPVGGSLDGDSKVVSVDKGSVTIEHRGKKQRLSLGGNPK